MHIRYIGRALEPVLRKVARQFQAVVLTGPRQSGKTTLLKHLFGAAPGLLPYLKERIAERRSARGQYLLTGFQNLVLAAQVTESLAGRAAMLRLLPLSQREVAGQSTRPLPWESRTKPASAVRQAKGNQTGHEGKG